MASLLEVSRSGYYDYARRQAAGPSPAGIFFRSASVDGVINQGRQDLHARGVRTQVDVRQHAEHAPVTRQRPQCLTTLHVDHDGQRNKVFWPGY